MINKTILKPAALFVISLSVLFAGCGGSSGSEETENGAEAFKEIDENRLAMHKGLRAFYEGDFETTIEKSLKVIERVPENALAYKRLGSGYYALGEKENALKAWERAVEIDPGDEDLKSYLNKIKERLSSTK